MLGLGVNEKCALTLFKFN